jgi:hypothetical protein
MHSTDKRTAFVILLIKKKNKRMYAIKTIIINDIN